MKNGWQYKKVSEIAKYSLGKMLDKAKNKGELKPYLRNFNVRWFDFDLSDVLEMRFLAEEAAKYTAVKGDVLICEGGYPGRAAIWEQDEPIYFQKALHRVRFHEPERSKWFLYYLYAKDLVGTLKTHFNGAGIQHFTGEALAQFEVPLPPLPEQKRIVGILDEAFDGIATAKANAEKNLKNARALFESHLQSVFTQRGKGWVERKFEDVCHKITDGTHHSPQKQFSERGPGRFPYITSKNIRNNYMDLSNVAYIERAFHDEVYARCQPRLGDVLLTKDGANTGTVTLNTLDEPFSLLSSVCLIKTNQAVLRPAFLCYYLQSSTGLNSIVGQMTGAAIKRIVLKDIKKAAIPFPPLKEQDNIVTTLNSLLAETQRLASIYQQKLAALDELKKSLLHRAFNGELIKDNGQ